MNVFKVFYCRCFQICMRIALPILPYRNPEIIDRMEDVPDVLRRNGKSCTMLVTDKVVRSLGLTASLEDALAKSGHKLVIFDKTVPNPTTDLIEEGLALYLESGCDSLIAVGGGSPMDCAKAIGARVARPKRSLVKMEGILKVARKLPLLIAVPTTAGTGSETTLAAVVCDSRTRHKYAINDFSLIPAYAVLDSHMTHTLPYQVAATTGMDAMTHAVEAYIGRSTTRQTRKDSEEAIKLIFANIESAAAHESEEAERAMLLAAHYAGRAFTRSYVGYVHAVSHSLGGKYNMPHGLTNAVLLPIVLEMYGKHAQKKLAKLARLVGLSEGETDAQAAKSFIRAIEALNARLSIPSRLTGIKAADIPELSRYAEKEANPLYPVPVLWTREQLGQVYVNAGAEG